MVLQGAKIGMRPIIWPSSVIYHPEKLIIGDYFFANNNLWVNAMGGVEFGNNVLIGPNVVIHSANHNCFYTDKPFRLQSHNKRRVIIGSNV